MGSLSPGTVELSALARVELRLAQRKTNLAWPLRDEGGQSLRSGLYFLDLARPCVRRGPDDAEDRHSAVIQVMMVREARLELARVSPLDPKSSASASSATLAPLAQHCGIASLALGDRARNYG